MSDEGSSQEIVDNDSGCPHEKDWSCQLLRKPCHPGMTGCILFGQPLIDALLAFEQKEHVIEPEDS